MIATSNKLSTFSYQRPAKPRAPRLEQFSRGFAQS
jgi:hypothetical protein